MPILTPVSLPWSTHTYVSFLFLLPPLAHAVLALLTLLMVLQGFQGVKLPPTKINQLVASAAVMNAIKTYAGVNIEESKVSTVYEPAVERMFVSLGKKLSITEEGKTKVVLPRVFEVSIAMEYPESEGTALPQGDNNLWQVTLQEVDPTTDKPLAGSTPAKVPLSHVDWSADSPLFLARNETFKQEQRPSEEVVRVQQLARFPDGFKLQLAGATHDVYVRTPTAHALSKFMLPTVVRDMGRVLASPMPGALVSLSVVVGQHVEEGQECAVIEAMKMQNVLRAPKKGTVKAVKAKAGETLQVDQIIVEFA
jgi:biotin carboxyl carrier protein